MKIYTKLNGWEKHIGFRKPSYTYFGMLSIILMLVNISQQIRCYDSLGFIFVISIYAFLIGGLLKTWDKKSYIGKTL